MRWRNRGLFPLLGLTLLLATMASARGLADAAAVPDAASGTARPRHVFLIVLENKNFAETFGPGAAGGYLKDLAKRGVLLENYYATGHFSLDNYIAMFSGQAPNRATQSDCHLYGDFVTRQPGLDADGQAVGEGCVYPTDVITIANQLEAKHLTWAGYMEDMANGAPAAPTTCRHPTIGEMDPTQKARLHDQYAAKHDPFVYFHSIIDDQPNCSARVVPLERLIPDLKEIRTTPNFAFITPNLCHDGHDAECVDGTVGGLSGINRFLAHWVPLILAAPAYQQDGMLIVTFDEAETHDNRDGSACCAEPRGPNPLIDNQPGRFGPGGGRIGAVILSPFVIPGTVADHPYNHYALLRSLEDLFGLAHLGYAGQPGLAAFGADVYNRPARRQ